LTDEGRKYADVEIPYWKGSLKITNFHARTIKPDGSITNFEGKPFDKTIVKARGVKILAKTFAMPEVSTGSIIEYGYRLQFDSEYVFDSHWIVSDELFTAHATFSLRASPFFLLKVHWNGLPPGAKPIQDKKEIHLELYDIPAFGVEDFMPPADEMKSRIDFTYSRYKETDPDKFWKQFGKECYGYLESFTDKKNAMEQAAREIVSPADSAEVKLEKIYARVQQLRNLSFEEDRTQQETKRDKEKWAQNVEDVWKWQRGTGVQLTWLFLALVRAAGMDASGVWVASRAEYFFDKNVMDGSRLATNVVMVKLNGKELYLDPGSAFVPFGLLPWSETGVSGYRLDKEGGSWITTTLPNSAQSRIERKGEFKLDESGDLDGTLSVTFTGLEAASRRLEERLADDVERKKFLEDGVKEWISNPSDVELTNHPDWKTSSSAMVALFTVKVQRWASAAGQRTLFPEGLFGAPERNVFVHTSRRFPIYFSFPFREEDNLTIEIPSAWRIVNLPAQQETNRGIISFSSGARNNNGKVGLNRILSVDILLLGADHYSGLRDFFQTIRTADEQQVLLAPLVSTRVN
jgi:hypothetical protein